LPKIVPTMICGRGKHPVQIVIDCVIGVTIGVRTRTKNESRLACVAGGFKMNALQKLPRLGIDLVGDGVVVVVVVGKDTVVGHFTNRQWSKRSPMSPPL
jgi:hypothetical protein